jgi:hypothetical protein
MRLALFAIVLCVASAAQAQSIYTPGYYGGVGPWQQSRVSPSYLYYNASAPYYPVSYGYGYGRGYRAFVAEESLYELRAIRRELQYSPRYRGR